jgi:hypothetical protein
LPRSKDSRGLDVGWRRASSVEGEPLITGEPGGNECTSSAAAKEVLTVSTGLSSSTDSACTQRSACSSVIARSLTLRGTFTIPNSTVNVSA